MRRVGFHSGQLYRARIGIIRRVSLRSSFSSMAKQNALESSPLLERLGIRVPIILAPMAGVSTPELVAAVSAAGGLGMFGVGGAMPAERLRANVRAVRARLADLGAPANAPFGFNLFVPSGFWVDEASWTAEQAAAVREVRAAHSAFATELGAVDALAAAERRAVAAGGFAAAEALFDAQVDVLADERVPVVSLHFGWHDGAAARLRAAGSTTLLFGCATSVAEAAELERRGVDAIIAQGSEAGGHQGTFLLNHDEGGASYRVRGLTGTTALVASIAATARVPVVAAGGIMDGRGVAAALALGAQAAQLGTAFLAAPESGAAACHKAALLASSSSPTSTTTAMTQAFTGKPARGLANRLALELNAAQARLPNCYNALPGATALSDAARAAGDAELAPCWAGQGHALARAVPAAELVAVLMAEARVAVMRLTGGGG